MVTLTAITKTDRASREHLRRDWRCDVMATLAYLFTGITPLENKQVAGFTGS